MVIVMSPTPEDLADVSEAVEHFFIQALVAQLAVEPKAGAANLSTKPFFCGLPGVI